jgi:hypothetical protein
MMVDESISGTSFKATAFEDVLPEVMASQGVRDLDELHGRYLEAGGEWDRESFVRHARGEDWFVSSSFFDAVVNAVGLSGFELFGAPDGTVRGQGPDWEPYVRLLWSYAGHPRGAGVTRSAGDQSRLRHPHLERLS